MSYLLNAALNGTKGSARAALFRCQMGLLAFLIGITGAGFLVFWVFDALSAAFGTRMAALLLGSGLILVATGILLFLYRKPLAAPAPSTKERAAVPTPEDASSIAAFTSAFVLGRFLTNRERR